MADNENIVACDYLTGDYDFMLKIQTQSSETLEHLHRLSKVSAVYLQRKLISY